MKTVSNFLGVIPQLFGIGRKSQKSTPTAVTAPSAGQVNKAAANAGNDAAAASRRRLAGLGGTVKTGNSGALIPKSLTGGKTLLGE